MSWEAFKKEYYSLQNSLKQELNLITQISLSISKQIMELEGTVDHEGGLQKSHKKVAQGKNIDQNIEEFNIHEQETKKVIEQIDQLIQNVDVQQDDKQAFVKNNLIQRFKEILKESQREHKQLLQTVDFNQKKMQLFEQATYAKSQRKHIGDSQDDEEGKQLIKNVMQLDSSLNKSNSIIKQFDFTCIFKLIIFQQNREAQLIKSQLYNQNQSLKLSNSKMQAIANSLPQIEQFLMKIKFQEHKRQIIISFVIAICIILMIQKILFG